MIVQHLATGRRSSRARASRDRQLRIRRQRVLERLEGVGRRQPRVDRLVAVAAPIRRLQHLRVAPDLRLRHASRRPRRCRRPSTCSGPTSPSEPTVRPANCRPRRGRRRSRSCPARTSGLRRSSLRSCTLKRLGGHAAQRHVGVAAGSSSADDRRSTNSSGDAIGPRSSRAMPGASRMMRRASPPGRSSSRCRCRRA